MSEELTRDGLYPLADRYYRTSSTPEVRLQERNLRARWTGEKRAIKAGEWFLSGAFICAYRILNDEGTREYHIAEIVRTETVTTVRVLGVP